MINQLPLDKKQIRETVERAVTHLRDEMAITEAKIKEIAIKFVNETPPLLAKVHSKHTLGQWNELASALHKIKSRYAYFGFEEIEKELSDWEEILKDGKQIDHLESKLLQVDRLTNDIIDVLKGSEFYESTYPEKPKSMNPSEQKSILIAEDDDVSVIVLEASVKDWGAQSTRALDGFEAISKTVKGAPDLIFMDLHMPFLSGLDAIRAIRGKGIKTAIVAMSASTNFSERDDAIKAGSNDFMTKPINGTVMQQMMDKYLGPSQ